MSPCTVITLILSFYVIQSLAAPPRPHVLFILSDDQGYRDVGYHGSIFSTPALDDLAAKGVKLENYYVQPTCTPTRSQLMTGRYQIRTGLQHGVIEHNQPNCLPLDEVTLAEKMREANYSTHIVGKWHLGLYFEECLPTYRGFDTFLGFLTGGENHYTRRKSVGYDFRRNADVEWNYYGDYSTWVYAQEAIDIIAGHDPDKSMFLYLPFQAVHSPTQVPSEYTDPYVDIITDASRLLYAGMVTCMDEAIWYIVDALKANADMYDNTVIVFSSDNGADVAWGGNNWPLRGGKGSHYEGGMRAIGFVHSPLLDEAVIGKENKELIHVSDWFPTIVEGIAGWNSNGLNGEPLALDGVNQWDTIKSGIGSARMEILHNIDPLSVQPRGGREWEGEAFDVKISAAIRYGDYKLITGDKGQNGWTAPPDTGIESVDAPTAFTGQLAWLFNIANDPNEEYDLSDTYPDIVIFLLERLAAYEAEALYPYYPAADVINSDPTLNGNGGVWGPWASYMDASLP